MSYAIFVAAVVPGIQDEPIKGVSVQIAPRQYPVIGSTVRLTCTADRGTNVEYSWSRPDGEAINPEARIQDGILQ